MIFGKNIYFPSLLKYIITNIINNSPGKKNEFSAELNKLLLGLEKRFP